MKKFICLLLILSLINVSAVAAPSSWAEESVDKANEMITMPDGFEGDWQKSITRKEFAELAIRFMAHNLDYELEDFFEYVKTVETKVISTEADGKPIITSAKKTGEATFTDCDDRFVLLAAEMGVVQGMGDNTFEPDRSITREEAAVMLTRARYLCANTIGYSTELFADQSEVSAWAKRAVQHMKSSGVMTGVGDNRFDPKGTYTREMAIITFVRQSELKVSGGIYKMRPTFERIYASYEESPIHAVKETIETEYGTLLVVVSGGAMHTGGQTLVFVTNDCKEYDFSNEVPYETPWGQAHYETMELSEDGTKLIYTYSFDDEAVYSIDPGNPDVPERLLHEKGQYVFTADLITGEVTYVINEGE